MMTEKKCYQLFASFLGIGVLIVIASIPSNSNEVFYAGVLVTSLSVIAILALICCEPYCFQQTSELLENHADNRVYSNQLRVQPTNNNNATLKLKDTIKAHNTVNTITVLK